MFKLNKPKSQKLGQRFEFKLSNLQALQVPKGWDKLLVSVVSVETGKTITKTGKASVWNGSCQWMDTLSESVSISDTKEEKEECLVRLVVAMGSGRFGILGEATINLVNYRSSKTYAPISFPLKKCHHGTILQVKIHCVVARAKYRDELWEDSGSQAEDASIDYDDMENKSDVSDNSYTRSVGSSSSNHLDGSSHIGELLSRDLIFTNSNSCSSFESVDGSFGRENYPQQSNLTVTANSQIGRQDSAGSQSSFPYGSYSFNDSSRSNHSSFNSKATAPRSYIQNQRDDSNQVPRNVASSPLQNYGPSKDLIEAAEVRINELREEARMWEKKSRKLMTDVETLQKELSDQSNLHAGCEIDLSESHRECNGLKEEVDRLNILLEESKEKHKANEEMENAQKELEDRVNYLTELNADLGLQLQKTQDSNIELVSILQELEDTIEQQKTEIANLSGMQSENKNTGKCTCGVEDLPADFEPENKWNQQMEVLQLQESRKSLESTIQFLEKSLQEKIQVIEMEQSSKAKVLSDCEAKWREKLAFKEEEIINLESKLSEALNAYGSRNGDNHDLINEIEVLKQKMDDLERDCNELTEENLELLHKLKQSTREYPTNGTPFDSLSDGFLENDSLSISESEVSKMRSQICRLEEELNKKEKLMEEFSTDQLQSQMRGDDLVKDCADLTLQLQAFENKISCLNGELDKYRAHVEGLKIENAALQQQLQCNMEKNIDAIDQLAASCTDVKTSNRNDDSEVADSLSKLHGEILLCLANVKEQRHLICLPANSQFNHVSYQSQMSDTTSFSCKKKQADYILNTFLQLKDLLAVKATTCKGELQQREVGARTDCTDNIESKSEAHNVKASSISDLAPDDLQMNSELEVSDSDSEILEEKSGIEKTENLLKQEEVEAPRHFHRELEIQISDPQNEKRQLEENMEVTLKEVQRESNHPDDLHGQLMVNSQVSANEILVKKTSELESSKRELEVHLSELESENVLLSERIFGLEAQLRYLTNDRESSRLELQNSESCAANLQDEMRQLQCELENQKAYLKQKLQEMQKKWLESQEECNHLKIANAKLQCTAENLIEECSTLQKAYTEIRKQKMELFEHCVVLEAELRELKSLFSNTVTKIETLDESYAVVLQEIASKEKALGLELDVLVRDNQKHKEELVMQESLLNQIYLEKTVEIDKLQREIAHLIEQISAAHDEEERTASDALEMSRLSADKTIIEASLEEIQGKLKSSEKNFITFQMEAERKLLGITDELAASKHNQEVLIADNEKLLNLIEDVKSKEEKHKSTVRELELKLKASEYERLQVTEEVCSLNAQLQRIPQFQNEILALKGTIEEIKFENQRLGASIQILSVDYEEMKAEKISSIQKISHMQQSMSELDDCRHSKVALEEKVLRLESDLTAGEALGAQNAELKNGLARLNREKSELRRRIKHLEEEKQESFKKAQGSGEEVKQREEEKQDQHQSTGATSSPRKPKHLQNDNKLHNSGDWITDQSSKIQLLENQLAEALEANEMYKSQLKSFLSGRCEEHQSALKNSGEDEDTVANDNRNKMKASELDTQLKDLQERYLEMSLKYAEVEAEREQLVLKLKSTNSGKSWFFRDTIRNLQ